MDIIPYRRQLWALLEVFGVIVRIIADVFGCPAAKERVLNAGTVCGMEVDELLVYPLLLKEVEGKTRIVVSIYLVSSSWVDSYERHT